MENLENYAKIGTLFMLVTASGLTLAVAFKTILSEKSQPMIAKVCY
jgi:hypothetical protein